MDPITQGALGAAATQSVLGDRLPKRAWWLGAWGGMAADLDILIRMPGDPMVALTFHRHFTHSLAFIPVGGLLCALPFLGRDWAKADRKALVAATTVGYATHALLDAFTSYGTMLGWPFSDARLAWNTISIIDPFFTLPLIVGVILCRRRASMLWARLGLALAAIYMALCGVQRARARAAQAQILEARGHSPAERFTFPLFFTNQRWRSLYREGDTFHADLIDVPWFGEPRYLPGRTAQAFDRVDAPADLRGDPDIEHALDVINWFTGGRMVLGELGPGDYHLCDTRYSVEPEGFVSIFCFELHPKASEPDAKVRQSKMDMGARSREAMQKIIPLMGDPGFEPLP